jgi:diguanylate cyclase (GGDEF)-like protein
MRWDWQDQESTYFIREFIRSGDAGGGYSDFYFGKPGDEAGSYKKRGYTLKFEPYGWYVSTGNYYENIDEVIAEIETLKHNDLLILFSASLVAALIGLFLVSKNLNQVINPIIKISNRVKKLSMGDTSTDSFGVISKDEIGDLNRSILSVISILHKLLEGIHVMISEHENGNVDYNFDTHEFSGDYKVLADSVLELAAFGMRDQLTGIPNRRSFDNRLDAEWKRAVRESTPISVLMIDIDKFKIYNDTFGHQQGDITLQTVAKVIRQSGKRPFDFAARWGGEEFAVLLPGTDSEGAVSVAEQLRVDIENAEVPCDDERGRRVTVSIGVSTKIPGADDQIKALIHNADDALYKAKDTGRNRVCSSE